MSSALYVTTKGFCKRTWFGALLAVGTLVIAPLLFRTISQLQGLNLVYVDHDLFDYHFAYLGISWVFFLGACLQGLPGVQRIVLGLPVSSKSIASWLMFTMVGYVVLLQLVTNGFYRLLFFDQNWLADYWPVMGPLLFLVTLIMVGHCIYWSKFAPSITRYAFWALFVVGMFWWFISRYYPNGFKADIVPWSKVTLPEFVTMQLVCIAAWYQGTRAFAQVRAGTAVPSPAWEQMMVWWNALLTGTILEKQIVPLSRRTALARLHWRDSCHRAVIMGGLGFGMVVFVFTLGVGVDMGMGPGTSGVYDPMRDFLIITTLFSLIAAVIVAVLIGDGTCGPGRTEMKRYLAIAPLTDRELNAIFMGNMVKAFASVFLLIHLGLLLSIVAMVFYFGPEKFKADWSWNAVVGLSLNHLLITVIGFWIIAANMISVFWTGRSWFYYTVLGLFFGGLLLLFGFGNSGHLLFPKFIVRWFLEIGILLILSCLMLGGTLAAFVVACQRKRIQVSTAGIACLLWLVCVFSVVIWYLQHLQNSQHAPSWFMVLFFISFLTLIVTPFATIPLALSWNRHR
ncbi:MAG: hypothetical protein K0U86_09180 [Planctomycetes bacterium]|nr:hypothetical protein [Planctomycetota bacterium]MCH9725062.1 hypothetical protein [Planctomycetota bacterium]MCH9779348.1 hypothetical protein [Planctomycetota bacterium]MCH9789884.1 hypothetical protein [Planctomycetota bacterium]